MTVYICSTMLNTSPGRESWTFMTDWDGADSRKEVAPPAACQALHQRGDAGGVHVGHVRQADAHFLFGALAGLQYRFPKLGRRIQINLTLRLHNAVAVLLHLFQLKCHAIKPLCISTAGAGKLPYAPAAGRGG